MLALLVSQEPVETPGSINVNKTCAFAASVKHPDPGQALDPEILAISSTSENHYSTSEVHYSTCTGTVNTQQNPANPPCDSASTQHTYAFVSFRTTTALELYIRMRQ